jgi:hypothetical protein
VILFERPGKCLFPEGKVKVDEALKNICSGEKLKKTRI